MPRLGLILPATSYRGPDFVSAAGELGVDLLVATEGSLPLTPGVDAVVPIDCTDPRAAARAVVAATASHPIDAVVGVDDGGVMVAALVAEMLGLPHNAVGAVAATRDKAVMREFLEAGGVPQPAFGVADDLAGALGAADEIGYPVVLKPRTLSASRGVIRVDDADALALGWDRVAAIAAEAGEQPPLLVERFVAGDEVAVEALATPSGVEVLAVFDKPDALVGPFFEETIYVTPSRHGAGVLAAVAGVLQRAVDALALVHGAVHAEFRLTADGPVVVEVASRSIGGLCGRSLRFGMLGQSLESLLIRAALGMPRRGMGREDAASGVMMLPIPRSGVLREVRGQAAIAEVDGITALEITVPPGREIRALPEGDRYLGFLFAAGETPGAVEAALREAHGLLDVVID